MKKLLTISGLALFIFAGTATAVFAENTATATATSSISFPIAELGNCADKAACKAYCSDVANTNACTDFAESHRLMTKEQILAKKNEIAKRQAVKKELLASRGPGGCATDKTCKAYCEAEEHKDECLDFAKKHNLVSLEKLKILETQKELRKAVKELGGPGGCKTQEECARFCKNPDHSEECVAFGANHGMSEARVKAMLRVISNQQSHKEGSENTAEVRLRLEQKAKERIEHFKEQEIRRLNKKEGLEDQSENSSTPDTPTELDRKPVVPPKPSIQKREELMKRKNEMTRDCLARRGIWSGEDCIENLKVGASIFGAFRMVIDALLP